MVESKAWSWELSDSLVWVDASEDLLCCVSRWKKKGYRNVLDLG